MAARRKDSTPSLFSTSEQMELQEEQRVKGKVEALGQTFASEAERREHFRDRLRERLEDPQFRALPGFPQGSDEVLVELSDPPWYTPCPNPFLEEFVRQAGRPFQAGDGYRREPFNSDTSEGKTHPVYTAHSYHTKVLHLVIVLYVLHYTEPGDLVLDGFCGSGMTGVAAQWCGSPPADYRATLEARWEQEGRGKPRWGARRVILNDLSPAATFLAANYNLPFSLAEFTRAARRILDEVEAEIGWMYRTRHSDGRSGRINYTVWSEVFACGACGGEVVFLEEALDPVTKRVAAVFPCPHCRVDLSKGRGSGGDEEEEAPEGGSPTRGRKASEAVRVQRLFEHTLDPVDGSPWKRARFRPVLINYTVGGEKFEKKPDAQDLEVLARLEGMPLPPEVPTAPIPHMHMTHERARMDQRGITRVHHFFLPRAAQALGLTWRKARAHQDPRVRNMLLWWVEQAIRGMSLLNRYKPIQYGRIGGSQVGLDLNGVYYISSISSEVSPAYQFEGKLSRLQKTFAAKYRRSDSLSLTTGTCAHLGVPEKSVDYIFTDPPFGENIYYSDMNFLVESWHQVRTEAGPEAIVDRARKKTLVDYQELMRQAFAEYHRVLKPGRWMTVVFHNSSNLVWNAIQEALGEAGFVVAEVRTLDKQQGSYRQVTSTAMKTDLVVSAYRPAERVVQALARAEGPWTFLREFLGSLSPVVRVKGELQVQLERTPQRLFDRLVGYYFMRRLPVPVSAAEFFAGLDERFPERDGMHFLPEQLATYEKARSRARETPQLPLFVRDEKTAIEWVRAQLHRRPYLLQDLTPEFLKVVDWDRAETGLELRVLLGANFLCYDGNGPVPAQVHSYLSSNYHDLRSLDKENPRLRERARGLWFIPDPTKAEQMEERRRKALVAEFQSYREQKGKRLKEYRKEAIRVGFAEAYERGDFQAVVEVADRLPGVVLEEDFELFMFVSNARTQAGL